MTPHYKKILDTHQQHRTNSCFQMSPELALKFAKVLGVHNNPFQDHHCWDGKGCEPYATPHIVGTYFVKFETKSFEHPYLGLTERLEREISKGRFPVVSLLPPQSDLWHGYIVLAKISGNDFEVVTKKGCLLDGECKSEVDTLIKKHKQY